MATGNIDQNQILTFLENLLKNSLPGYKRDLVQTIFAGLYGNLAKEEDLERILQELKDRYDIPIEQENQLREGLSQTSKLLNQSRDSKEQNDAKESQEATGGGESAQDPRAEAKSRPRQITREPQSRQQVPPEEINEPNTQEAKPQELPQKQTKEQSKLEILQKEKSSALEANNQQLANLQKQKKAFEANIAQTQNAETREQLIGRLNSLNQEITQFTTQNQKLSTDIQFLDTQNQLNSNLNRKIDSSRQILNLVGDNEVILLLQKEGYQIPQITPELIEARRKQELQKYLELTNAVEIDRQRRDDLVANISNDINPAELELDISKSGQLETQATDAIAGQIGNNPQEAMQTSLRQLMDNDEWQKLVDRRSINKILRSQDPFEILGIDSNIPINEEFVRNAYRKRLIALYASNDPRARRALDKLRLTYQFYEAIGPDDDNTKIREKAKFHKIKAETREAQEIRRRFETTANRYEIQPTPTFSVKDFIKDNYKNYKGEQRQAVRNVLSSVFGNTVGRIPTSYKDRLVSITSSIDRNIGKGIIRLTGISQDERTRYTYVANRKGFRIGRIIPQARPNKKKEHEENKRISITKSIKLLYDRTVGRVIETARNTYRLGKDLTYTYSGLKSVNNQRRLLAAKINTKIWSGRVGKTLINLQRGANGIRAITRSSAIGLRNASLTAVALYLTTGGLPIVPILAIGGLSTATKLISDTLESKAPHFSNRIFQLQQKYGALGDIGPLQKGQATIYGTSRIRSALRSVNAGFYGMATGTLISLILPINPLLAAGIGFGAGMGTSYATKRVVNKITLQYSKTGWYQIFKKMPMFSILDLASGVPWLNSQYLGFKKYGLNFLKSDWLNFKSLRTYTNILEGGFKLHSIGQLNAMIRGAAAARNISFLGMGAGGSALLGAGIGTGIGLGVALLTGTPLGAGMLLGATIGATVGFAVGSIFGPIGSIITSSIFSFLGSKVGGWIDSILGKVNMLETLLGTFSALKGIVDFIQSLNKRFDPTSAFGLVLTIIFSAPIFIDLSQDMTPSNASVPTTTTVETTALDPQNRQKVKGLVVTNTTPQVIDCLGTENKEIINPNRSTIKKIKRVEGVYEIHTEEYIFTNIQTIKTRLELNGSIQKNTIIGTCPR